MRPLFTLLSVILLHALLIAPASAQSGIQWTTSAKTAAAIVGTATAGCRRHQRQARSKLDVRRAAIGRSCRKRRKSAAISPGVW